MEKAEIDYIDASDMLHDAFWHCARDEQPYRCLEIFQTYNMSQETCDKLILDAWSFSDYPNDHPEVWQELWDEYYVGCLKEQQESIHKNILPNTKIYRGGAQHGRSWTLDKKVAELFFQRSKYRTDTIVGIWEKTIQPQDVLAYIDNHTIDGYSESEVLLIDI